MWDIVASVGGVAEIVGTKIAVVAVYRSVLAS
jgi:hypothetical protein